MKHLQLTEELQERAILYAAGALDENERREYARHLDEDKCDVCLSEVLESEVAAQSLLMSVPVQTPSESVKKRLMAQAEAVSDRPVPRQEPKSSFFAWAGWLAAAASAVLLVVTFGSNSTLRNQVAALNSRVVDLENQMSGQQTVLASLTSPETVVIKLAGKGATTSASAKIYWDVRARQWHVYVSGLPQAASARTYQLWFVPKTGNPISASVFNTKANGTAQMVIPVPAGVTSLAAAAVTDEPSGGSPQPTASDFVMIGNTE